MSVPSLQFRREDESLTAFAHRLVKGSNEVIVLLSPLDNTLLADETDRSAFFRILGPAAPRIIFATRSRALAHIAGELHFRTIDRVRALREIIPPEQIEEALRVFSPNLWQQQLRSRLQTMGLLSLPKVRIWVLIFTSTILFLFVIFRLLPSAEVRVWPRRETVTQTVNIYMFQSGTTLPLPAAARRVALIPISVEVHKAITFDQITDEFTGTRSQMQMKIFNKTTDLLPLRAGTRLVTLSGGLVFRLKKAISVPANGSASMDALADDTDLYGVIMGSRGNIRPGLRFMLPGLDSSERDLVYAQNVTAGRGGSTASVRRLQQKDIPVASKKLDQALIDTATKQVQDRLFELNQLHAQSQYQLFTDKKIINAQFHDYQLPQAFVGQAVTSVPVEGSVTYTVFAYDAAEILAMMREDIVTHIEDGKVLVPGSISLNRLNVLAIKSDPNFKWVKVTADLSGTEEYVLDAITPAGAEFGKKVREAIAGVPIQDAIRILKNLPEVEQAQIHLWPPWGRTVPALRANISIVQQ